MIDDFELENPASGPDEDSDMGPCCGRCYALVDQLFDSGCQEKPEKLLGAPIGQYHCPDCGAMVLAGLPHPTVCAMCRDRKHPGFDGVSDE